jgi:hypothetical protein
MVTPPSAPPLFETDRPRVGEPILVSGLGSTALLDATGELSLPRETRGGPVEWGGFYGQEVRLTGPWHLRWATENGHGTMATTLTRLTSWRWGVESHHETDDLNVRQRIYAANTGPGIFREVQFTNRKTHPVRARIEHEFVPYLCPVLLEGIKPYHYRAYTVGSTLCLRSHTSALSVDSDPLPDHLSLNRASWIGHPYEGEISSIMLDHDLILPPGVPVTFRWLVAGGTRQWVDSNPEFGREELGRPGDGFDRAKDLWTTWLATTPEMEFPDAPDLEQGYRLAKGALRALYRSPDASLTGLVAGFPWYLAFWCRDLAWMLPAVLWLGDTDWARRSIESVLRFQAPSRLQILGAEPGELPMQISPGPVFLFGTSDSTLLYAGVVRRYAALTGDLAQVEEWFPKLERMADWAARKVDPESHLIRNGGEISTMRTASEAIGKVHYGFDAVDTTIWDSADRRDHAIDIQVLWHETFSALAELAEALGRAQEAIQFHQEVRGIQEAIQTRYHWPEEGYLFDSLHRDGTPVRKVRPNALRAVTEGLVAPDRALEIVRRAARDDLTTPWGVRTLSRTDPGFAPTAYHDGQVWTIATAWAASAALIAGDREKGMEYLLTNARHLVAENGYANECYRGDRPEPYNSCFLLGFSVAPFLTTLFDDLWGLRVQMVPRSVRVVPRFPSTWTRARLTNLKVGPGRLTLDWEPGQLRVHWSGPGPLAVAGERTTIIVPPEVPCVLELPRPTATASGPGATSPSN